MKCQRMESSAEKSGRGDMLRREGRSAVRAGKGQGGGRAVSILVSGAAVLAGLSLIAVVSAGPPDYSKGVVNGARANGVTDLFFRKNKVIGGGGVYAPLGTARLVGNRMSWVRVGANDAFVDIRHSQRMLMSGNVLFGTETNYNPPGPLVALAPNLTGGTPFSEVDGLYDNTLSTPFTSSYTFLEFQPDTDANGIVLERNRITGSGVFAREAGAPVALAINGRNNWWGSTAGPGGVDTPIVDVFRFLDLGVSSVNPTLDVDRDGLTIGQESHYSTTEAANRAAVQASKDTDGDRVPDGVEVAIGTDPLVAESHFGANLVDADLDGLPPTITVAGLLSTIDPDDSRRDVDGDGVMDAYELVVGTSMQDASDAVQMGDVNGDGSVMKVAASRKETGTKGALIDSADNVMLIRFFLRTPSDSAAFAALVPELSDLNRDGSVDNADAYRLQLLILGSISVLPTR